MGSLLLLDTETYVIGMEGGVDNCTVIILSCVCVCCGSKTYVVIKVMDDELPAYCFPSFNHSFLSSFIRGLRRYAIKEEMRYAA